MNKIQDIVSAPFFTVISFRQKRRPPEGRLFEIPPRQDVPTVGGNYRVQTKINNLNILFSHIYVIPTSLICHLSKLCKNMKCL